MDCWSYNAKFHNVEIKDTERYVNLLFVVETSKYTPDYAGVFMSVNFWGFPSFKNLMDKQEDTQRKLYGIDGNTIIDKDRYGDNLKEATLEQVMDYMHTASFNSCLSSKGETGYIEELNLAYSMLEQIWKKDRKKKYKVLYYKK